MNDVKAKYKIVLKYNWQNDINHIVHKLSFYILVFLLELKGNILYTVYVQQSNNIKVWIIRRQTPINGPE